MFGVFAGTISPWSNNTIRPNIQFNKVGIEGDISGETCIGGFIGELLHGELAFYDCYSKMNISVKNAVSNTGAAGFAMSNNPFNGDIIKMERCYWTGTNSMDGNNNISSLIKAKDKSVVNSYYDKQKYTSGYFTGTGLTTEEMKKQTSYVGWDFENTWYMGEDGYPELKFKNK